MKVAVTDVQIQTLPLHDAEVLHCRVDCLPSGLLVVQLNVSVHEDESMEPFYELGIRSRSLTIHLDSCEEVRLVFRDWQNNLRLLDSWDVVGGLNAAVPPTHAFTFSDGSEIRAGTFFASLEETAHHA